MRVGVWLSRVRKQGEGYPGEALKEENGVRFVGGEGRRMVL